MQQKTNTFIKEEKGITGLETAIVLIAFVIVASVLSYVVISAGLFSSQKAKSAVNSGLDQSGATIELKSDVTALMDKSSGAVTEVYFTVGLVPGGSSVDLTDNPTDATAVNNKLNISYSDATQEVPSLYWTVIFINANNGDNMLDPGELAQITVYLDKSDYTTAPNVMSNDVVAGTLFSLDVIPPDGSILPIERQIPAGISFPTGSTGNALINLY